VYKIVCGGQRIGGAGAAPSSRSAKRLSGWHGLLYPDGAGGWLEGPCNEEVSPRKMPHYDDRSGCLRFKVVFWGPGHGGKTTALRAIHAAVPVEYRGRISCLDTDTRRTLFFDHASFYLGEVGGGGPRIVLDAYTVPGQVFYREARRLVLEQADGVALVADSSPDRQDANVESLASLREILDSGGVDLDELPLAFLYNKRDLPGAVAFDRMREVLNPRRCPDFAAVASRGEGVLEVLNALCDLLLERHVFRGIRRPLDGRWFALPGFGG